jgi:hypothetical protein
LALAVDPGLAQHEEQQAARPSAAQYAAAAAPSVNGTPYVPGQVYTVHSPEELEAFNASYPGLVVLMCKASHCRPCKFFAKKYQRISEMFPGTAFMVSTGVMHGIAMSLRIQQEAHIA